MIWFLFGIIVFTLILNQISLKYGFEKLNYTMEVEKPVVEIGEDIPFKSIIENPKPLTVSFLKVNEKLPSGLAEEEENVYSIFMMPYQRIKRSYHIKAVERGLHRFTEVELILGDFVGFENDVKRIKINSKVTILPEKINLKDRISPAGDLYGDVSVKRWIIDDPLMTVGIRAYTEGDPQKYIHWASSMRYGELMVKQFDFTTDHSVMILLNIETAKPYWRDINGDLIEEAIKVCRAVIEEMETLKISYGFVSNAFNIDSDHSKEYYYHPGTGKTHQDRFLEILGNISYVVASSFEETVSNMARRKGSYSTVVIVTPKILESYINPMNKLSKVSTKTVVIAMDDENLNHLNDDILKYRGDKDD